LVLATYNNSVRSNKVNYGRLISHWAELHHAGQDQVRSWIPAESILQAARFQAQAEKARLGKLLKRSQRRFRPLDDPLVAQVGLNRWLQKSREEAYSDWLAWILEQIGSPEDVFSLLQIEEPAVINACRGLKCKASREVVIPDGRLDIVVRIGQKATLVVEVKTTSAEAAATAKQQGYVKWLKGQPNGIYPPSLLVVDAAMELYSGFVVIRWADLCVALRRMFPRIRRRCRAANAAMVIAFIGAVETNLLRLVAPTETSRTKILFYTRTIMHLERSLRNL